MQGVPFQMGTCIKKSVNWALDNTSATFGYLDPPISAGKQGVQHEPWSDIMRLGSTTKNGKTLSQSEIDHKVANPRRVGFVHLPRDWHDTDKYGDKHILDDKVKEAHFRKLQEGTRHKRAALQRLQPYHPTLATEDVGPPTSLASLWEGES